MDGTTSGHSSRFARFDTNGLWQFSSVLCGAALLEALAISNTLGIGLWDEMAEPILLMHIHNMMLQTGYIEEPIATYATLPGLFYPDMFKDGKPPLSELDEAMLEHLDARYGKAPKRQRPRRQAVPKTATEFYRMLNADDYQRRKPGTVLSMWRRATWNPDRIPDEEVMFSLLIGVRLAQTKHVVDPRTGEAKLEMTPLVSMVLKDNPRAIEDLLKGSKAMREALSDPADPWDLNGDILDGQSGLNVVRLATYFILTFKELEKALREVRNKTYIRVYESGASWSRPKPVMLMSIAFQGHDRECLRTMARVLERRKDVVEDFKYWKDTGGPSKPNIDVSMCCVM
ncbi:hypothetical protein PG997_000253 [Apiospora hydei]|uniref:Uncharacterized protein n=1 Tax=Apiospora hydei TaxID=1337664 RepID=A0ABR1XAD0_9PEZI